MIAVALDCQLWWQSLQAERLWEPKFCEQSPSLDVHAMLQCRGEEVLCACNVSTLKTALQHPRARLSTANCSTRVMQSKYLAVVQSRYRVTVPRSQQNLKTPSMHTRSCALTMYASQQSLWFISEKNQFLTHHRAGAGISTQ